VCVGLSGLSVGLGARFPVLGQRNPARIASGLGGTINLIASMLFVTFLLLGAAMLGWREFPAAMEAFDRLAPLSPHTWRMGGALLAFSVLTAGAALWSGARHFERLEA
jgi:ABC-2 type transport system permease protein